MKRFSKINKDNVLGHLCGIGMLLFGVGMVVLCVFINSYWALIIAVPFIALPLYFYGLILYQLTPMYKKKLARQLEDQKQRQKETEEADFQRRSAHFQPIMECLAKGFTRLLPTISVPEKLLQDFDSGCRNRRLQRETVREMIELLLKNAGVRIDRLMVTLTYGEGKMNAGLYESDADFEMITVNVSVHYTKDQILGTILHESAHKVLFSKNIVLDDTEANEEMTDAATFLLGWPEYSPKAFEESSISWTSEEKIHTHKTKIGYISKEDAIFLQAQLPIFLEKKTEEEKQRISEQINIALKAIDPLRFLWKKIDDALRSKPLKGITIAEKNLVKTFVDAYRNGSLTARLNRLEDELNSSESIEVKSSQATAVLDLKKEANNIWKIIEGHQY